MSARGFRSVFMAGAVASAALGCYLVSLRVASERAALETVETRIVLAQRDIRLLETEIGTRGRLAQLERWNVKAIQLSAPTADQFVESGFQLATLVKPESKPAIEAPVVLAAAPAPQRPDQPAMVTDRDNGTPPGVASKSPADMMHVVSYSKPAPAPRATAPARDPRVTAAPKDSKPAKAATKSVKTATADPLAPLSGAAGGGKGGVQAKRNAKDSGTP